ncbi:MAG: dihydroorotase family protein [Crenarchaeota archaeon]|nr:dihydroorotase family protein [Thermoproteota archaeon]MDW8033549.1 dihydroorotase family protein [Nitrososphaerota archaeon]
MKRVETLFTGRVYHKGEFKEACIGVDNGIISFIGKEANAPSYDEKVDFKGLFIIPGLIDIHAHLRGMRLNYKEDFLSGTSAAAAGGFTLVFDMPNTDPPTNSRLRLMEKTEEAETQIIIDIGFYFGKPEEVSEAEKLVKTHAIGLKLYPEDYSKSIQPNIVEIVNIVRKNGKRIVFHPEDASIIERNRKAYPDMLKGVDKHSFIRNVETELSALDIFYRTFGAGAHATHLTTVESIMKARANRFTYDVSVNHLALTNNDLLTQGGICKVNPPLRSFEERKALIEAFNEGRIAILITDHAPHTLEEKNMTLYDEIPSGIPCFETAFSVLLDMVHKAGLNIYRLVEAFTRGPAEFLGDKKLGTVSEGSIANLTVFNPKEEWKVDPEEFYTKAKHSPFAGRVLRGRVKATVIRGVVVFQDGEIKVQKGFGKIYGINNY